MYSKAGLHLLIHLMIIVYLTSVMQLPSLVFGLSKRVRINNLPLFHIIQRIWFVAHNLGTDNEAEIRISQDGKVKITALQIGQIVKML